MQPSAIQIEPRISRIYDHLYANAPVRTPSAIAVEVGKILHTALYLERRRGGKSSAFEFSRADLRKLETGKDQVAHVVANECRTHFTQMNAAWNLYAPTEQILLSDFDLAYICAQLSGVLVSDADRDVLGDALEIFRCEWAKRNGGQFFTDQRVTRLAITLLQFRPIEGEDLVDMCAGTGGFLLAGLRVIEEAFGQKNGSKSKAKLESRVAKILKGQEADPELCAVANSTIAARLGVPGVEIVRHGNSLQRDAFSPGHSITFDGHSCAATNPPFGTKITVKDPELLRHYELAYAKKKSGQLLSSRIAPTAPDTLFIEQNLRILKPGRGRLAIVVPYQILSGPQTFFVREWLLRNSFVLAAVELPPDTFQPHTGTKACLLVIQRREKVLPAVDLAKDPPIFMSMPRWIGHDRRGNPVYRRNPDGSASADVLTDFPLVERAFQSFLDHKAPTEVHPESFVIKPDAIGSDPLLRINAAFHRPTSHAISSLAKGTRRGQAQKDWRFAKLHTLVRQVFYPGRFKRNYVERSSAATPFLGGAQISQLLVNTDKWLSPDDPMLAELRVRSGWILVTRSGSTGIVSLVPEAWDGYAISEHVIRIVPDSKKLPGEYLYAFLRTRQAQEVLQRGVYGSVIDEINPQYIEDLDVPVPVSSAVLQQIVEPIRSGEGARNNAILLLNAGVEQLEKLLGEQ